MFTCMFYVSWSRAIVYMYVYSFIHLFIESRLYVCIFIYYVFIESRGLASLWC